MEDPKEDNQELLKKAKMKRRNGKAALTRLGKVINVQMARNRSNEEIQKALDNYEQVFSDLEAKHEEVTMLVEDDLQFQQEELWIEQCQEAFLRLKIEAQDYMKNQAISKTAETGSTSKDPENSPTEDEVQDTEEPVADENDTSTLNEENTITDPRKSRR